MPRPVLLRLMLVVRQRVITIMILVATCVIASPGYAQSLENLHVFSGGNRGWYAHFLIAGNGESLIGTAAGGIGCEPNGCGIIYELEPNTGEVVIHDFTGEDGEDPFVLISDGAGGLYGTTSDGGIGCGNIFHLQPTGQLQSLYAFKDNPDGCGPNGLVLGSDGNLYGTTYSGGGTYNGTVFKLDKGGHETVIYTFTGGADGALPGLSLLESAGSLYGLALAGGTGCFGGGCGVIYKIDQTGKEAVLYAFTGTGGDGAYPASLLRDAKGNFYGSTSGGGNTTCESGCGTLFKLTQGSNDDWSETVLYAFTSGTDGAYPGKLVGWKGSLYGTTAVGMSDGCSGTGCGTIFKFDATKTLTTLYTLTDGTNGYAPWLSFVDGSGNFYGTTYYGGDFQCINNYGYGCGTVFRFTP